MHYVQSLQFSSIHTFVTFDNFCTFTNVNTFWVEPVKKDTGCKKTVSQSMATRKQHSFGAVTSMALQSSFSPHDLKVGMSKSPYIWNAGKNKGETALLDCSSFYRTFQLHK